MIGQTISHYKILEKPRHKDGGQVGEGGMGIVYKAQDTKLDRTVALKFLPAHLAADEQDKKRFTHEAKAASSLDHLNICTVYEVDETPDGQMFLAMALYEGASLSEKIKQGPLKIDEAMTIVIQVAEGLQTAHEKGIIHRDIKSGNLMLTEKGQVKLMDFGLAKSTGASMLTKSGATVGTVPYMTPEQARGEKVDHRTDIWSLGVVLYEMIAGRLPFKSAYSEAIVYSILNEEPPPLTSLRSDVPMELERIVNKCLVKNPNERYQSLSDMLVDLRKLHKELETGVSKDRLTKIVAPPRRRTVLYASLIGLVAFTFVVAYFFLPSKPVLTERKSVAVLPFVNMSNDPRQEYFSDGLSEELLNLLSKIPELKVIGRTSSFSFKGKNEDLRVIGEKLGVAHILEGSVQKEGNRIRVTAQLIRAADGSHLWSEKYDRDLEGIFKLQDEIAGAVVKQLKLKLLVMPASAASPTNIEVHNLILQGNYFFDKLDKENVAKALDFYYQALAIDSLNARAWAAVANSVSRQAWQKYIDQNQGYEKAREAAAKAIALDENLAEGYLELGDVKLYHDFDWEGAEAAYQKAMSLEPGNADLLRSMADLALTVGHWDEAIRLIKQSIALDPLKVIAYSVQGSIFTYAHRLEEAIVLYKKALELNPQFQRAHLYLGRVYLLQGKPEMALAEMQQETGDDWKGFGKALAYHALGRKKEADEELRNYIVTFQRDWAYQVAELYAFRGEKDKAFEWLEKAYIRKDSWLVWLKGDPLLKNLESNPRHTALLKKMGLEK